jgi:hypothetical protein
MEYKSGEECPPSDKELLYLGFESWQIARVRQLDIKAQWIVYYEYARLLMEGDESLLDF